MWLEYSHKPNLIKTGPSVSLQSTTQMTAVDTILKPSRFTQDASKRYVFKNHIKT